MLEFSKPVPVVTEDGLEGYALYVTDGGAYSNDVWCVVIAEGGHIRHYTSDQLKVYHNATFGITKLEK